MALLKKNNINKAVHVEYNVMSKFTLNDLENYDILVREDEDYTRNVLCLYINKDTVKERHNEFKELVSREKDVGLVITQPKDKIYKTAYGFFRSPITMFSNKNETIYEKDYANDKYTHLFKFFRKSKFNEMTLDEIIEYVEKELKEYGPFEKRQY